MSAGRDNKDQPVIAPLENAASEVVSFVVNNNELPLSEKSKVVRNVILRIFPYIKEEKPEEGKSQPIENRTKFIESLQAKLTFEIQKTKNVEMLAVLNEVKDFLLTFLPNKLTNQFEEGLPICMLTLSRIDPEKAIVLDKTAYDLIALLLHAGSQGKKPFLNPARTNAEYFNIDDINKIKTAEEKIKSNPKLAAEFLLARLQVEADERQADIKREYDEHKELQQVENELNDNVELSPVISGRELLMTAVSYISVGGLFGALLGSALGLLPLSSASFIDFSNTLLLLLVAGGAVAGGCVGIWGLVKIGFLERYNAWRNGMTEAEFMESQMRLVQSQLQETLDHQPEVKIELTRVETQVNVNSEELLKRLIASLKPKTNTTNIVSKLEIKIELPGEPRLSDQVSSINQPQEYNGPKPGNEDGRSVLRRKK